MHCGVMVTGYNQGDWKRLLAEDHSRPPTQARDGTPDTARRHADTFALST